MSKPSMASAIARTTHEQVSVKQPRVFNARATPKRQGKRGLTVYLDPTAHAQLKEIVAEEEITLETLILEGINYALHKRGRSPIA